MFRYSLLIVMVVIATTGCSAHPNGDPSTAPSPTATATASPVQIQSFTETSQSMPIYSIHCEWPALIGELPHLQDFNLQAESIAMSEISDFRKRLRMVQTVPNPTLGSYLKLRYTIENRTDALVAVRYWFNVYWEGGATDVGYSRTLNYSLMLGRALVLTDMFTPNSDFVSRLAEYSSKDFQEQGFENGAGRPLVPPDAEVFGAWLVVPEGLKLVFSRIFVCCGPAGEGEVVVPYQSIDDIIAPSFKYLWEP